MSYSTPATGRQRARSCRSQGGTDLVRGDSRALHRRTKNITPHNFMLAFLLYSASLDYTGPARLEAVVEEETAARGIRG